MDNWVVELQASRYIPVWAFNGLIRSVRFSMRNHVPAKHYLRITEIRNKVRSRRRMTEVMQPKRRGTEISHHTIISRAVLRCRGLGLVQGYARANARPIIN